jgi:hypothetical protein
VNEARLADSKFSFGGLLRLGSETGSREVEGEGKKLSLLRALLNKLVDSLLVGGGRGLPGLPNGAAWCIRGGVSENNVDDLLRPDRPDDDIDCTSRRSGV